MRSYTPVVPSKSTPDSRPKWARCIPVFRPKRCKNPTKWGGTCLYSLYKGVPPPPGETFLCEESVLYHNKRNWFPFYPDRYFKKKKVAYLFQTTVNSFWDGHLGQYVSVLERCPSWISVVQRCLSYRESNKGSKERQGPAMGVRFTEVSVL